MKKLFTIIITVTMLNLWISTAFATDYALARAIITWDDGLTDDSLVGAFGIEGTMSINNGVVIQLITFCRPGEGCKVVVDDTGSVTSIGVNDSSVTIRSTDSGIGELNLISLAPSIITMFTYEDGTIEMHEWRVIEGLNAKRNSLPNKNKKKLGAIGRSIASALRPSIEK